MKQQFIRQGGVHILYNADAMPRCLSSWFDRVAPESGDPEQTACGGRAPVLFFTDNGDEFVLKHYCRGGWLGRFVRDRYCYTGDASVRSFREWRLLAELQRLGLPAPVPHAARYCRYGWCYSADLITVRLPGRPLSQLLMQACLPAERWRAIGAVLRRFHDAGIYHADLNAHNILLGDNVRAIFLVDFDKARIIARANIGRFAGNLKRLQRSLVKLRAQSAAFMYQDRDFSELIEGYGLK